MKDEAEGEDENTGETKNKGEDMGYKGGAIEGCKRNTRLGGLRWLLATGGS